MAVIQTVRYCSLCKVVHDITKDCPRKGDEIFDAPLVRREPEPPSARFGGWRKPLKSRQVREVVVRADVKCPVCEARRLANAERVRRHRAKKEKE